ncbi:LysR family transcriptional regulator [Rhodobacteraceae bacterium 2CG4]|uniref:LysR family transcriptional regulator n=1 Tax=Halovulum marinum TaxID=2662447 RepID=A0A6L5YYM2_9RHOB|nr:LysR substrate-binding domain-containing protein [Halovulum marinum]MSU89129.1 LysR family transcriptional regulator [Halovulum marinum]
MRIDRRNDLSLRLLEIFGTMMLRQTTVDAAADLGISQPAVSLAIKQLEGQLGFQLFERRSRRLQPTEEARSLFAEIEPIFLQLRAVEGHVRDLRKGTAGKLRVIATPPLGHSVIPVVLRNFLAERPGVSVQYDVRRLEHVIEEVETGASELGVVLGLNSHPAVDVRVLRSDHMVALVHRDHALAGKRVLSPQDCAAHGHIGLDSASRLGLATQMSFEKAGVPYQPRVEVRYCHTAAVLANSGLGVAVVDSYTAGFLSHLELSVHAFAPEISVGACLLTRRDATLSRLAQGFVAEIESVLGLVPPAG